VINSNSLAVCRYVYFGKGQYIIFAGRLYKSVYCQIISASLNPTVEFRIS